MAEANKLPDLGNDISDQIVERLKAEGQLTRNTGTNSLKAIINIMDKSSSIMTDELSKIGDILLEGFAIIDSNYDRERFERLRQKDEASNKGTLEDVASGTIGKDELFGDIDDLGGLGNIIGAAFLAYWFDVDKYIRAIVLPKTLLDMGKAILNSFEAIAKGFKTFAQTFLGNMKKFMSNKFSTIIMKPFVLLFDVFSQIFRPFTDLLKGASKLSGFLKTIPVFGQVLAAVFAIFDFVTGFYEGFTESNGSLLARLADGAKEGIIKAIRNAIMIPLDILKDVASWVAGKLGFEDFQKTLDEFSFENLFDDFLVNIKGFIMNIFNIPDDPKLNLFDAIIDKVSEFVMRVVDYLGEGFRSTLKLFGIDLEELNLTDEEQKKRDALADKIRERETAINDRKGGQMKIRNPKALEARVQRMADQEYIQMRDGDYVPEFYTNIKENFDLSGEGKKNQRRRIRYNIESPTIENGISQVTKNINNKTIKNEELRSKGGDVALATDNSTTTVSSSVVMNRNYSSGNNTMNNEPTQAQFMADSKK